MGQGSNIPMQHTGTMLKMEHKPPINMLACGHIGYTTADNSTADYT